MTIGPQEIVRSEVEGGLSGPANPIPEESLDCGCAKLPCPKLAKYATRGVFVAVLCWIGLAQAASHAYFQVTSSTVARRFQFNPNLMDWLLTTSELAPIVLGLAVAYWADKIHRAAWCGALVLLQSVAYFSLIIPHFTHNVRNIEETTNGTHMSLHAEDSPELCNSGLSRIIIDEDEPCYATMVLIVVVQVLTGISNVAYYSLGISYLDDNTRKKNVTAYIGVILAVKVAGVFLGFVLAWGCLRLDAESFDYVKSYQEQIGAWWLGWPILSILLFIPGLLMSWFPRRLPSEVVVEQAAASLLNLAGQQTQNPTRGSSTWKVGSTNFLQSFGRLISNKILICNIFAAIFISTALFNFMSNENIILEARFHVPRPTGLYRGFGDPLPSRMVATLLKPIIFGLVAIISGLLIARAKPTARALMRYNIVVIAVVALIVVLLIFAECDKPPIVSTGSSGGSLQLKQYCNKNCRCSKDADFRPICDDHGKYTFYSPCHAGCTAESYKDNVKVYGGCGCVAKITNIEGNTQAREGPCGPTSCQLGWIIFEFGTMIAYSLVASTVVGSLLVNLRSVYVQDKALSIGFWMTCVFLFTFVPGKIIYGLIADATCEHWGHEKTICHLYNSTHLGDYLSYLTAAMLVIGGLFKVLVWHFSNEISVYDNPRNEIDETATELNDVLRAQTEPLLSEQVAASANNNVEEVPAPSDTRSSEEPQQSPAPNVESPIDKPHSGQSIDTSTQVNRVNDTSIHKNLRRGGSKPNRLCSEDELESSSDESKPSRRNSSPKVAYRPLDIDSDVESDMSAVGPRSRSRLPSKEQEEPTSPADHLNSPTRKFPNPDHYDDPRLVRTRYYDEAEDGSKLTDSIEFKKINDDSSTKWPPTTGGSFNEVGIPIVETNSVRLGKAVSQPNVLLMQNELKLIESYKKHASQDALDYDREIKLEREMAPGTSAASYGLVRPPSRGEASSGFGSLPDIQESTNQEETSKPEKNISKKEKLAPICTDL